MLKILNFQIISSISCFNGFYIFIIIFILNLIKVRCCMPGYEVERAKLRQYLGIEWVPNGLKKIKDTKLKPVRHANELNCDFSNPSLCHWENLNKLDTLDFYLFRKEDYNDFPVIQVRPGPSKIAIGDQLIFVGDRKHEEQSAILVSSPIRCQNSTGRLTFTFWIYNGANIEVVILVENSKTHEWDILGEKQHVNCGPITVNTECNVEIESRENPFRIGIKAYDIKNIDGSFVMIDNIYYEAEFCKVSIDFGNNFRTEELVTAKEGDLIQTSSQLSCYDFGAHCKWRNGGPNEKTAWRRGITSPPTDVLFNETGTYTVPVPPFAFIYIEEETLLLDNIKENLKINNALNNKKKGHKFLISEPILCQSSTNPAIISFRFWTTKGIEMSICAIDLKMNDLDCQKISKTRSPAPVYHEFNITQKFMYAFKIDNVNSDFDNFVIIDDIEYSATMCLEALNTIDLGTDFYTTPLLSTFLQRNIRISKELACDFSRRGVDCHWSNLGNDSTHFLSNSDTNWEIGLGRIDEIKFASLTNRSSTPVSDLAIARLLWQNATAILISETVRCISDKIASLSFRYWKTGGTSLSICIIGSYTHEVFDCQLVNSVSYDKINAETDLIIVDIPNFAIPVRFALRAEATSSAGVVAIDDINFEGRICPHYTQTENKKNNLNKIKLHNRPSDFNSFSNFNINKAHNVQYGTQNFKTYPFQSLKALNSEQNELNNDSNEPYDSPDENVCRLLTCNFESSHMCLFKSEVIASSVSMFKVLNQSAYAMLFERGRIAVLESVKFTLNSPARLHFDLIIKKGAVEIHVCKDSVQRELDSCDKINSAKTNIELNEQVLHDFVELLPTNTKIYIIAKLDKHSRKANVFIDNIELKDTEDHSIC